MVISCPPEYNVTVKYEDIEYKITDRNFYEKHKDKVGETVKVVCHKRYYDDGTIEQDIEAPGNY